MKKKYVLFCVAVGLLLAACESAGETEQKKEVSRAGIKVKVMKVAYQDHESLLNYSGIVAPSVSIPLSFQLPGKVSHVFADEGDWVKQGQPLASLNKTTYQSSFEMAKATEVQAQDAYNRLKKVHDNGSLPEIKWQEATANLKQAIASKKIAKQNLNNTVIVAPADGVIGSRNAEVGETATPSVRVFTVVDVQKLYVRISVPESEIGWIAKGQQASVSVPALGLTNLVATVSKIGVEANMISKTYEVKLLIRNHENTIRPGMACDVQLLHNEDQKGLSVPFKAILHTDDNTSFIYTVDPNNKIVIAKAVEIGKFVNNDIRIKSGIEAGELVVVEGQQKLHDGARVVY